ncbi:sugar transferase [Roseovarius sp. D22-M7]|uniref:sugar transferase n=1 Tax=Roseovarius sp. D22-M7 TaxID=3127116 RepID=UPI00300FDB91
MSEHGLTVSRVYGLDKTLKNDKPKHVMHVFDQSSCVLADAVSEPRQSADFDRGPEQAVGGGPKRALDIVFAIFAILTFLVPIILIMIGLKVYSRGPIFFAHERVGLGGTRFRCLKFRTMVEDAEERLQALLASDEDAAAEFAQTRKLKNDPRIVPYVGAWLRKSSMDELPQFFNVLAGEMSVVGPRPVTEDEIREHYGFDHAYMKARPGITGLWQVSGRNDIDYAKRVALDEVYIKNWNFRSDLSIILRTAAIICRDRNGY